jgi:hypothetical protein
MWCRAARYSSIIFSRRTVRGIEGPTGWTGWTSLIRGIDHRISEGIARVVISQSPILDDESCRAGKPAD